MIAVEAPTDNAAPPVATAPGRRALSAVGLFAGIGGIELGLRRAGHDAELLCEIDPAAQAVLRQQFPTADLVDDVRHLRSLPRVDLVAAGFPCQDLSQAGRTAGIRGTQSSLVAEVFRLLSQDAPPTWVLLENVPFMLQLDRGNGMRFLVDSLEQLGFRWAYRVVDTRAFGLPQRRQRVLLLASQTEDPAPLLFGQDVGEPEWPDPEGVACGFYWTEGLRGLGWAVDAVPTLKGGSGLGIPSPPAIRLPDRGGVVVPDIRDAERLQGFPSGWTTDPTLGSRKNVRWKLIGNAVSVPVAEWLGERLAYASEGRGWQEHELSPSRWPRAARGQLGERAEVQVSEWPVRERYVHLTDFLVHPGRPLSERAAAGFLSRARRSRLRFPEGFLDDVEEHLARVSTEAPALR